MHGRLREACIVALVVLGTAPSLRAQTVRGVVRDSVTDRPLPGAVVILLDANGAELGRALSGQQGRYQLAVPQAISRIRALHMGFRPREESLVVPPGGSATADLSLRMLSTMLAPVNVRVNPRCSRRGDREAAYGLWDQVSTGLLATIVAKNGVPAEKVRLRYTQTTRPGSELVVRNEVRIDSIGDSLSSFSAVRSTRDFIRLGFTGVRNGKRLFFGPDAEVLLDSAFVNGYCLGIATGDGAHPAQVGVTFAPVQQRLNLVDVAGTIWIDTAKHTLHDIAFKYVGLEPAVAKLDPGGTVSFREMPNGVVVIDHWQFRLVDAEKDTAVFNRQYYVREFPYVAFSGGELARAQWSDGTVWHAPLGALRAKAVWRDGKPAAGTAIFLDGTDYLAVVDSLGALAIDDLVPGPYAAVYADPRLAELDVQIPTALRFTATRDSVHRAQVVLPTAEEFVVDRCVADKRWKNGDSTFVFGVVRYANGELAKGADVELVSAFGLRETAAAATSTTGADGMFQYCGNAFSRGGSVLVTVRLPGGVVTTSTVKLSDALTLLNVRFPDRK